MIDRKWIGRALAAAGVLSFATAAYAWNNSDTSLNDYSSSFDTQNGGAASQASSAPRNFNFSITSSNASRAEIRRDSQNSGSQSMGGRFVLRSGGQKASIIQVLNVNDSRNPTGPSTPVAQLGIRPDGTKNGKTAYGFYVVQKSGQPDCTSEKVNLGEFVNIKITYSDSASTRFDIGGSSCTHDTAGEGNRYYYGKLGIYDTTSGSGASSAGWDLVYD